MIEQTKITESNYKFFLPRVLAFFFWIIMTVWNIYFLIFFNYQGKNNELFGLFQLLCVFIFCITFVLGIYTIFMPNTRIYSFSQIKNKVTILEKAAFAELYKIRDCFPFDSIENVQIENSKILNSYNLVIFNANRKLVLFSHFEKTKLLKWAEEIKNPSKDEINIQTSSYKYMENTYIIFIIIQLLIYADIIRQTLILLLF